MPKQPRKLSQQAIVAAVLGLHVLLLFGLANLGVWRDRGPQAAERPPLQVWLLPGLRPGLRPQVPAAQSAPPAERPALPQRQSAKPAQPAEPQAITLPTTPAGTATAAPTESAPVATAAATAASAASAGSAKPPPLNLALPRGASAAWRTRNPALDDHSARSARATFEGRFAREMGGDGVWVEERIDTDRIRFRRGGTCVDMERSRAEQLNGFNQTFSPKPWVAKQPRDC